MLIEGIIGVEWMLGECTIVFNMDQHRQVAWQQACLRRQMNQGSSLTILIQFVAGLVRLAGSVHPTCIDIIDPFEFAIAISVDQYAMARTVSRIVIAEEEIVTLQKNPLTNTRWYGSFVEKNHCELLLLVGADRRQQQKYGDYHQHQASHGAHVSHRRDAKTST